MEDPGHSTPVLVMLPDASIRMYVGQGDAGAITAAHVLRDYPGHALGQVPDARRPCMDTACQLQPGATYFLLPVLKHVHTPADESCQFHELADGAASRCSLPHSRSPSDTSNSCGDSSSACSSLDACACANPHAQASLDACACANPHAQAHLHVGTHPPAPEQQPSRYLRKSLSGHAQREHALAPLPASLEALLRYSMPFPPRAHAAPDWSAAHWEAEAAEVSPHAHPPTWRAPRSRRSEQASSPGSSSRPHQLHPHSTCALYAGAHDSTSPGSAMRRQASPAPDFHGSHPEEAVPESLATGTGLPRSKTAVWPGLSPRPILEELQEMEAADAMRQGRRRTVPRNMDGRNPILQELQDLEQPEEGAQRRHARSRNPILEELELLEADGSALELPTEACACCSRAGMEADLCYPDSLEVEALQLELQAMRRQLRHLAAMCQHSGAPPEGPAAQAGQGVNKKASMHSASLFSRIGGLVRRKSSSAPEALAAPPRHDRSIRRAGSDKPGRSVPRQGPVAPEAECDWAPRTEMFFSSPYQKGVQFQ